MAIDPLPALLMPSHECSGELSEKQETYSYWHYRQKIARRQHFGKVK